MRVERRGRSAMRGSYIILLLRRGGESERARRIRWTGCAMLAYTYKTEEQRLYR